MLTGGDHSVPMTRAAAGNRQAPPPGPGSGQTAHIRGTLAKGQRSDSLPDPVSKQPWPSHPSSVSVPSVSSTTRQRISLGTKVNRCAANVLGERNGNKEKTEENSEFQHPKKIGVIGAARVGPTGKLRKASRSQR